MTWVKLDEHMPENPKVIEAGPVAAWLHVCGIAYCNRNLTDGFIPRAVLHRLADLDGIPVEDVAEKLVRVGLWERDGNGWWIHDFHDYQPTAEEQKAKRKAKADAGRAGGVRSGQVRAQRTGGIEANSKQVLQAGTKQVVEAEGKQKSNGLEPRSVPTRSVPTRRTTPPTPPPPGLALVGSDSSPPATVADDEQVFLRWCETTGRNPTRTRLDDRRRKVIRRSLKGYPLVDVLAAVSGWRNSPYHRGENERGTTYNDLELLLRDSQHIERFRDLERHPPSPIPQARSVGDRNLMALYGDTS